MDDPLVILKPSPEFANPRVRELQQDPLRPGATVNVLGSVGLLQYEMDPPSIGCKQCYLGEQATVAALSAICGPHTRAVVVRQPVVFRRDSKSTPWMMGPCPRIPPERLMVFWEEPGRTECVQLTVPVAFEVEIPPSNHARLLVCTLCGLGGEPAGDAVKRVMYVLYDPEGSDATALDDAESLRGLLFPALLGGFRLPPGALVNMSDEETLPLGLQAHEPYLVPTRYKRAEFIRGVRKHRGLCVVWCALMHALVMLLPLSPALAERDIMWWVLQEAAAGRKRARVSPDVAEGHLEDAEGREEWQGLRDAIPTREEVQYRGSAFWQDDAGYVEDGLYGLLQRFNYAMTNWIRREYAPMHPNEFCCCDGEHAVSFVGYRRASERCRQEYVTEIAEAARERRADESRAKK